MSPFQARFALMDYFKSNIGEATERVLSDELPGTNARSGGLTAEDRRSVRAAAGRVHFPLKRRIDVTPAYRVSFHVLATSPSFGLDGGKRRYVYEGELMVECLDERAKGERVMYAMALAASRAMQNRRIPGPGDSGSVAVYCAEPGEVASGRYGSSEALQVRLRCEFEDRG